jgi:hypothetical protein
MALGTFDGESNFCLLFFSLTRPRILHPFFAHSAAPEKQLQGFYTTNSQEARVEKAFSVSSVALISQLSPLELEVF